MYLQEVDVYPTLEQLLRLTPVVAKIINASNTDKIKPQKYEGKSAIYTVVDTTLPLSNPVHSGHNTIRNKPSAKQTPNPKKCLTSIFEKDNEI